MGNELVRRTFEAVLKDRSLRPFMLRTASFDIFYQGNNDFFQPEIDVSLFKALNARVVGLHRSLHNIVRDFAFGWGWGIEYEH